MLVLSIQSVSDTPIYPNIHTYLDIMYHGIPTSQWCTTPPRGGIHIHKNINTIIILPCNQDSNNNYSPPKTREAYLIQKIKFGKGVI